jgi:hypothetical protein
MWILSENPNIKIFKTSFWLDFIEILVSFFWYGEKKLKTLSVFLGYFRFNVNSINVNSFFWYGEKKLKTFISTSLELLLALLEKFDFSMLGSNLIFTCMNSFSIAQNVSIAKIIFHRFWESCTEPSFDELWIKF